VDGEHEDDSDEAETELVLQVEDAVGLRIEEARCNSVTPFVTNRWSQVIEAGWPEGYT
jgi:hypothetical protein